MQLLTKVIIFDYGRTLYDPENSRLFPRVKSVLHQLSQRYQLAIASLVTNGDVENRWEVLRETNIMQYFASVLFSQTNKDALYASTIQKLHVTPAEVAIVDDRTAKAIRWGNRHGAITIWFRNGKFSQELPDAETGQPSFIIHRFDDLLSIL